MKFLNAIIAIVLLSMLAMPVLAELTDYQKGVLDGLGAGMRMGRLLGEAPYDSVAADNYNKLVNSFNQGLASIFGNNQTAINLFLLKPYGSAQGVTGNPQNLSFKPVHTIDSSFNQTKNYNADLEKQGQYYGYDLDSYIAMTGHVPNNLPTYTGDRNTYSNLGGV